MAASPALSELQRAANDGQPYRLVLLDCMMPGIDGFTLADLLQGNSSLACPAMITISSSTRPGDFQRCRDLGIARHMTKPVIKSELFDAIIDVLGEHLDDSPCPPVDQQPKAAKQLRVLLVEDGVTNQRVATGFLEQAGHNVSIANNGKEAVEATDNEEFDIVLMDVQMPVMDGHEATAAIREREEGTGGHLTIIAMTAAAMKGARELCLQSGMDAYVSKPIDADELFGTIDSFCSDKSPSSESPTNRNDGNSTPGPVVDFEAALKTIPGDVDVLRELASLCLEECPSLLSTLEEALDDNDATAAKRAAHTLRSSSRIIAADDINQLCSRLEVMASNNELAQIGDEMPQLHAIADRTCSAITHWLGDR